MGPGAPRSSATDAVSSSHLRRRFDRARRSSLLLSPPNLTTNNLETKGAFVDPVTFRAAELIEIGGLEIRMTSLRFRFDGTKP